MTVCCVALFSGGLDSMLAIRLMQEQDIEAPRLGEVMVAASAGGLRGGQVGKARRECRDPVLLMFSRHAAGEGS